jgi:hypothetical protein
MGIFRYEAKSYSALRCSTINDDGRIRHCLAIGGKCTVTSLSVYIMSGSEAARGHDTSNLLSPHIHPISLSCLLGWITSTILLLWGLRRINVRRIFSAVPWPGTGRLNHPVLDTSDLCEPLARDGRSLHVSLYSSPACYATQSSLSSWEFFTTLDYEWRVIRGDLPYRWTIWVRNRSITLVSCALALIWPFGRSTPSRVWLLS